MNFFNVHHHHRKILQGIYNLNLDEEIPESYFSVGIHPKYSERVTSEDWDQLEKLTRHPKCIAIGECGLDGLLPIQLSIQESVFRKQIALAQVQKKPLIIHCVRRFNEILQLTKNSDIPLILHGFNKKEAVANSLLRQHFYISFGESLLYHVNLQELVKKMPIDHILLETDDAEITVSELYHRIAELRSIDIQELCKQINQNLSIFNIPLTS